MGRSCRWRLFPLGRLAWRWALALLLVWVAGAAIAQDIDATGFGRSIPLRATWVAAPGNDPRWALPFFDDSRWTVLQPGKLLPSQGFAGARSIWYRMHVRLGPNPPPMAFYVEGMYFNYSVYADGVRIGRQGDSDPMQPNQLHPAEGFRIPSDLLPRNGGPLLIAIHVSGGPVGFLNQAPMDEGTHLALVGPEDVPIRQSFRLAHDWSGPIVTLALNLLIGLCGLVIWWSLREQWEYLALAAWLFCTVATALLNFAAHLEGAAPLSGLRIILVLVMALSTVAELEFMRLLLKRQQTRLWVTLEAIAFLVNLVLPLIEAGKFPLRLAPVVVIVRPLITEVFVFAALLRGTMRGNRDAPLLLLPMALWSFADFYNILQAVAGAWLKLFWPDLPEVHVFSYTISFVTLINAVGMLSLMMIILRRTIRLSREKADLASEVAAAEELQVLLLARASRPTPGYVVETVYRPAGQVGGDFFLVAPCEDDNSLVAIVGDVSGKGLQAAMRVSMILGVLQRDVMSQPDRVLKKLNEALLAQNEFGFTTACCVRLEDDGSFCFANAGHLNPYLEGQELVAEGALPLGMDPEACYPVLRGRLLPGQRMVLMSDGVPEARSRKGELFGFARTVQTVRKSAITLADTAQQFGQEDDITVLSLTLA